VPGHPEPKLKALILDDQIEAGNVEIDGFTYHFSGRDSLMTPA